MNILIICANGVSSGLLSRKIEEELRKTDDSSTCVAASQMDLEEMIDGKDYILVGPQLRIMYDILKQRVNGRLPISLIDSRDYGTMKANNIVEKVLADYNHLQE